MTSFPGEARGYHVFDYGETAARTNFVLLRDWETLRPARYWRYEDFIDTNANGNIRPEVLETLEFLAPFYPAIDVERINPRVRDIPSNLNFRMECDSIPIKSLQQLRAPL
jgi:hypothetical protein